MDLTPRLLTDVEFREQWRGYSQTDVDDFLKRVAAGVGELQEQLREATERATVAERRLLERSDDDEIRRTLVLAQRTALQAVEEAQAEATRVIDEATEAAAQARAEIEARVAAAEAELAEKSRVELGELNDRKAALQADVDALAAFQEEHRNRLVAELQRQLAELEAPTAVDEALAVPPPPEVSEPEPVPEPVLEVEMEPVVVPEPVPAAEPDVPRAPTDEEVAQAREDLVEALRRAGVEDLLGGAPVEDLTPWEPPAYAVEPDPEPEPEPEPALLEQEPELLAPPAPRLYDAADESGEIDVPLPLSEPTGVYDVLADDEDDDVLDAVQWREPQPAAEAPAPEPAPAVAHDDDDPFLAELRRAVTDTEPLGPRDDDDLPHFGTDDDAVPSGRFRLRRGR